MQLCTGYRPARKFEKSVILLNSVAVDVGRSMARSLIAEDFGGKDVVRIDRRAPAHSLLQQCEKQLVG